MLHRSRSRVRRRRDPAVEKSAFAQVVDGLAQGALLVGLHSLREATTPHEVADRLAEGALRLSCGRWSAVALWDGVEVKEGELARVVAVAGEGGPRKGALLGLGADHARWPLCSVGGRVLALLLVPASAPRTWGLDLLAESGADALERARAGSPGQQAKVRLEAAARAHEALRPANTVRDVHQLALEEGLRQTMASMTMLLVRGWDEAGTEYLEITGAAGTGGASEVVARSLGRRLLRPAGLAWRVVDSGAPVYVPDVAAEADTVFLTGEPVRAAYVGVPLTDALGELIGVLSANTAAAGGDLVEMDRYTLEALAQAVGAAVGRLEALALTRVEAERYRRVAELSGRLETLNDPEDIAREALEAMLGLTQLESGMLAVVGGGRLHHRLAVGQYSRAFARVGQGAPLKPGEGLLGSMLAEPHLFHVPDYLTWSRAAQHVADGAPRTLLAAPLYRKNALYGALILGSFSGPVTVRPEDVRFFEAVARRVERALERALHLDELRQNHEAVLRAIGLTLEYRDYETKGHIDRVTTLALRLGRSLNLSEDEIKHLRWGSYLHDVGKIAIPDAVLLKPGHFTPDEWEIMKSHVLTGVALLSALDFIPMPVLEIVRHHHERWNGRGYPNGQAGDDIPLLARIFQIADVYDALTSERPYKPAWSHAEALAEIVAESGRGFDPTLVAAFARLPPP
ncbi:HD domain-containing phosphohydrolase [Deinococcus hopiensis]|uniref:Response regulator containing a CheY-like receiver domain and an HD-GYP domain n=1 Tax=Deinococcus hopiensis KR-140 TaxID=695939 RepID=A0A1W1VWI9_9DEIO|nr:HD domain-containing phosphohydrolase [Deinococcus hopiensis]SMB97254.1 Response regulator containing a CheY-like receiver domain and an HD-GYP domain [Deinococcus hopiensis KR-140]